MRDKKELRKNILDKRDNLSTEKRIEKSKEIESRVVDLDVVRKGGHIFMYLNFRSEVETLSIAKQFLENYKNLYAPVSYYNDGLMEAVPFKSLGHVRKGAYGILEPIVSSNEKDTIDPEIIDIVLVPGAVFDIKGSRIGYGGGYYDRFFPRLRTSAIKIGIAFELQLLDHIPQNDYDIPMDFIVTEKRVLKLS